ncbi:hypothetical protein SLA2020_380340 [Shorea laevis]
MPPKEQRTNKERLDELELQVAQIGGIAEGMSQLAERVDALEGGYRNVQGLVDDMSEDFRATVEEALRNEIGELTTKVNLLVRAVGTTGPGPMEVGKVRVPEPRPYGGARDAKARRPL